MSGTVYRLRCGQLVRPGAVRLEIYRLILGLAAKDRDHAHKKQHSRGMLLGRDPYKDSRFPGADVCRLVPSPN
jgi:hypothetical protein